MFVPWKAPPDLDPRRQALLLYFQGYRIARIAEMLAKIQPFQLEKATKWGKDAAHNGRAGTASFEEGKKEGF